MKKSSIWPSKGVIIGSIVTGIGVCIFAHETAKHWYAKGFDFGQIFAHGEIITAGGVIPEIVQAQSDDLITKWNMMERFEKSIKRRRRA